MGNYIQKLQSKDGEIITLAGIPITGYIDDLVDSVKELDDFIMEEIGRHLFREEWDTILHLALIKSKV